MLVLPAEKRIASDRVEKTTIYLNPDAIDLLEEDGDGTILRADGQVYRVPLPAEEVHRRILDEEAVFMQKVEQLG